MLKIRTIFIFTILALTVSVFGFNANAQTAPSITTGEAAFIAPRNVYLNVTVNPNGSYTNIWFQIDTIQPPTGVRGYQGAGSGTSAINLQAGIINLRLDTTYYYRAVGQNSAGLVYGEIRSFKTRPDGGAMSGTGTSGNNTYSSSTTTNSNYYSYSSSSGSSSGASLAPSVTTNGPVSVSANSAVINGSVNPNNTYTTYWFEFGLSQVFGQKTSVESAGAGNAWQLVTGNLSGLETGKVYYYRVVAQNNRGTSLGEVKSFTTGANQTGQAAAQASQASQNSGGQVLGLATTSGNGSGVPAVSRTVTSSRPQTQSNPRPSFISLEYSLADNGALVFVANDAKPKPGKEFTYTVVYKNDSQYSFNEANLKIIIPSEADYLGADVEPNRTSGSVVEFELDNIAPGGRGTVSVTVKIKETIKPGVSIIFTSVLGYKDRFGTQLATTSYMTVIVNDGGEDSSLSASFLSSIFGSSGMSVLIAVSLIILLGLLAYTLVKVRQNGESGVNDNFGLDYSSHNKFDNNTGNQFQNYVPKIKPTVEEINLPLAPPNLSPQIQKSAVDYKPVGVIAFSFALRKNGEPNPCNVRLANMVEKISKEMKFFENRSAEVVSQWEISKALNIPVAHIVEGQRNKGQYLDSEEVIRQDSAVFKSKGIKDVVVVAQPFLHLTKCKQLVKKAGFSVVNKKMDWIGFDAYSDQPWTRGPFRLFFFSLGQLFKGKLNQSIA